MHRLANEDEVLTRAFLLAHFIHGDGPEAVQVVAAAMNKLEVAVSAQGKRLYYRPAGRPLTRGSKPDKQEKPGKPDGFRNKVSLNDLHVLQRLIYIESEPYERRREQEGASPPLSREDLLVHFIKHLVRITVKRNSFYVTLGLSRLLYNYHTAEAMNLYNVVVQDPERVKDDYYYRSRKGVLMNELKERFGNLVNTYRGPRGEERFRAEDDAERYAELVGRCLSLLTPWNTTCTVPAAFDPVVDSLPGLSFKSQSEEDQTEVNRIHAVLHPDCFRRLTEALGFNTPDERLTVPQFSVSRADDRSGDGPPGDHRRAPPEVNEQDLRAVKERLGEESARRRTKSAGLLRILVDGVERARLDPERTGRTSFAVGDDAELIEVRGGRAEDEILLAAHLLTRNAAGDALEPFAASVTLEGRQKLSITVAPSAEASATAPTSPPAAATVVVSYRETNPIRAAALYLRRARHPRAALFGGDERVPATGGAHLASREGLKTPALATAFALLFICAAAGAFYLQRRGRPPDEASVTNNQAAPVIKENAPAEIAPSDVTGATTPTTAAGREGEKLNAPGAESVTPAQPSPPDARRLTDRSAPANETAARAAQPTTEIEPSPPLGTPAERDSTRAIGPGRKAATLSEVRKIHVEVTGGDQLGESFRSVLTNALRATGRFVLSDSRDEADALFKISFSGLRPALDSRRERGTVEAGPQSEVGARAEALEGHRAFVVAQLINARGEVIWPARGKNSGGRYEGLASDLAAHITRDLLNEMRRPSR